VNRAAPVCPTARRPCTGEREACDGSEAWAAASMACASRMAASNSALSRSAFSSPAYRIKGGTRGWLYLLLTLPFSSVAMRLGPVLAGPVHSWVGAAGRFAAVCCVRGGGVPRDKIIIG